MIDASSFIFNITNNEWFPPSQQREVMYLQQILPVIFSKAGVSLKYIMISYIINVYLVYFSIFCILVWLLKDPYSSLLYLFVQIAGSPYSYFLIGAEILPGSAIVILLISILYNLDRTSKYRLRYFFSFILLFLTIRSHPLITVCFFIMIALLYVTKKDLIKKHKKFFIAFSVTAITLILQKLIFINSYEQSYISTSLSTLKFLAYNLIFNNAFILVSLVVLSGIVFFIFKKLKDHPKYLIGMFSFMVIGLIVYTISVWAMSGVSIDKFIYDNNHKFINLIIYLFHGRLFFTFSLFAAVVYFISKKQYLTLIIYVGSVVAYALLIYSVMDFSKMEVGSLSVSLRNNYSTIAHDTWGLPLRIIAFSGLLLLVLPKIELNKYMKYFMILGVLSMIVNFSIIEDVRAISTAYIEQAEMIMDSCVANDITKAVIPRSQLDKDIPVLNHVYQDILVLSSLKYDSSIQVVYAPKDSIPKYMELPDEYLILEQSTDSVLIDQLNTTYYKLEDGEYIYLDIE